MIVSESTTNALWVAIPMIAVLFAGFFRLDELLVKPKKRRITRRNVGGSDRSGRQVCIDPDGSTPRKAGRRA